MILSKRTFGVEIEHGNKTHTYHDVEVKLRECFPRWAKGIHDDGSGIEVVSPVLCGNQGLIELRAVMKYLQRLGGFMGKDDGFHVHHGGEEFLDDKHGEARVARLVESWANNQRIINRMLPQHRNENRVIANPRLNLSAACFKQLNHDSKQEVLRYVTMRYPDGYDDPGIKGKCARVNRFFALNVEALGSHGTVEVRQHHGTWDVVRCKTWIKFGQRFIERSLASDEPLPAHDSVGSFLGSLGMNNTEIAILSKVS